MGHLEMGDGWATKDVGRVTKDMERAKRTWGEQQSMRSSRSGNLTVYLDILYYVLLILCKLLMKGID